MKKVLIVLMLLTMLAGQAWATAWTEDATTVGNLTLTPADGTTSYDSKTNFANGMYLTSILFVPSAANDVLVVRNGSATGAIIAKFKSIDGGPQVKYFSGTRVYRPYILYTDNTLGTATSALVIIEYQNKP